MKKTLKTTMLPETDPRKGDARREPDVQTAFKRPQQVKDFERRQR